MSRFHYPTFIRPSEPRRPAKRQNGKIRRCGRNGHVWDHSTLQCTRCGCWSLAKPLGLLAKAFLP